MQQDLTKLTDKELDKLYYDLELESQHYDGQEDVHGNEDGYYTEIQRNISEEMGRIAKEQERRMDIAMVETAAAEFAYDRMVEA